MKTGTLLSLTLAAALTALGGCGTESNPDEGPTYYQHVRPILEGRCTNCHAAGGIAPFSLDSYDTAKEAAMAVKSAVASRTMPPWMAGEADVEYRSNPSLSDAQISTIGQWADSLAPEGDRENPAPILEKVGVGMERIDLELPMQASYVPKTAPDDYHCFAIPWEETETKYVTGFNALPGNTEIVHHIAVYLIPPDYVDDLHKWDDSEEGPGYTCFGGPSGGRSAIPTLLLSAWIPGYGGVTFPDGLGIKVEPGSWLAVQMHYNVTTPDPEPDLSTLNFQLADSVRKEAIYAPYLNVQWVVGDMTIPAGESAVEHSHIADPRDLFGLFINGLDFANGFEIHAALFHMHKLGHKGEVKLLKQGQQAKTILNIEDWDFDWQQEYYLTEPAQFEDGDQMKLSCVFDNSPGNQPCFNGECKETRDVNWGEGSDDEMCVVNMLISPR